MNGELTPAWVGKMPAAERVARFVAEEGLELPPGRQRLLILMVEAAEANARLEACEQLQTVFPKAKVTA